MDKSGGICINVMEKDHVEKSMISSRFSKSHPLTWTNPEELPILSISHKSDNFSMNTSNPHFFSILPIIIPKLTEVGLGALASFVPTLPLFIALSSLVTRSRSSPSEAQTGWMKGVGGGMGRSEKKARIRLKKAHAQNKYSTNSCGATARLQPGGRGGCNEPGDWRKRCRRIKFSSLRSALVWL